MTSTINIKTLPSKHYKQCRVCLQHSLNIKSIWDSYSTNEENITNIAELLQSFLSIKLSFDIYPQFICNACLQKASDSYYFRLQLTTSEKCLVSEINREVKKASKKKTQNDQEEIAIKTEISGEFLQTKKSSIKFPCDKESTIFKCNYCDTTSSKYTDIIRHKDEAHPNLKTYKCPQCFKTFFKKSNLNTHLKIHAGIKQHMCETCGASFALIGNLSVHRRLHTGFKPYICAICNRTFTQQAALRSHEAVHSGHKNHKCSQCNAAFSRAGALRNHMKRHSSERPFACLLCDKAFKFSSEHKRHMTIHTGEKSYECKICGHCFNRNSNLRTHLKIHVNKSSIKVV